MSLRGCEASRSGEAGCRQEVASYCKSSLVHLNRPGPVPPSSEMPANTDERCMCPCPGPTLAFTKASIGPNLEPNQVATSRSFPLGILRPQPDRTRPGAPSRPKEGCKGPWTPRRTGGPARPHGHATLLRRVPTADELARRPGDVTQMK